MLPQALKDAGIPCEEYDLTISPHHDMSSIRIATKLMEVRGDRYAHFAPPCNSFSMARFPKLRLGL